MGHQSASAGRPRDMQKADQILSASLRAVTEHGMNGLRMDVISRESGISRPTLYRWWKTPEEIVLEALRNEAAKIKPPSPDASLSEVERVVRSVYAVAKGPLRRVLACMAARALDNADIAQELNLIIIQPRRIQLKEVLLQTVPWSEQRCEIAIDLLLGPFWYGLIRHHLPEDEDVETLIRMVMPPE